MLCHQGQARTCFPVPFSSLFSCDASGSTASCWVLVLKNGTLHPASQIPRDEKCSLACLKKQQNVANVKDLFSSCSQLSTNNTETLSVSKTCLLYRLCPPGASAGRDPHEISLLIDFFTFCFKGNKENKCIIIYGRTCALPIRTGASRTGQAIHVWIPRKSKWLT